MITSPGLLASLKRSRLMVRRAHATMGIGERRSRRKGSGMEFVDYREYQPGDDVRHLDPHLHLRTGGATTCVESAPSSSNYRSRSSSIAARR